MTTKVWRKSSYSGGQANSCVEVATDADTVDVRDSKHPAGGFLTVSASAWSGFVTAVRGR